MVVRTFSILHHFQYVQIVWMLLKLYIYIKILIGLGKKLNEDKDTSEYLLALAILAGYNVF